MIQRIQTVYLALAVILLLLCCCMPLAQFAPEGMGVPATLYSLVLLDGNGVVESYCPTGQFLLLAIAEVLCIAAIFGYKNRRRQMKICSAAMCMLILWYVAFAAIYFLLAKGTTLVPEYASCLPVIALIFCWLARKAIKKDDDLVRSADRIR